MRIARLHKWIGVTAAVVTSAAGLVLPQQASAAGENWLGTWANRIAIAVDSSKIDQNLTDFPVMIHISASSGANRADLTSVFANLGSDANRAKIAVTTSDGLSQCYVEIAAWNTADKEAVLWVKVPLMASGSDTVLYLYYDSTQANNSSYVGDVGSTAGKAVWDVNYVGVYHVPSNALNRVVGEFRDSTSKGHSGTGGSANISIVRDAVFGKVISLDGVNDYISIPDTPDFSQPTTGYLTVEHLMSPGVDNVNDSHADSWDYMGKGQIYQSQYEYDFCLRSDQPYADEEAFYNYNLAGGVGSGGGAFLSWIKDDWIYGVGRLDLTTVHVYCMYPAHGNAVDEGSQLYSVYGVTPRDGSSPFNIGGMIGSIWFKGRMGEIRISNSYRSNAWLKATYYAESDGLLTYGVTLPPVSLSITTSALANGTVGVAYSQTLTATGGTTPYTWSIASGTLPAGLSLSSSGLISGTPTTAGGPTSVTFRVTDSASATATKAMSIAVVASAAWDVNQDGVVSVLDMISVGQHWGETGSPGWIRQDVNGDGAVNVLDQTLIGQHWSP